MDIYLTSELETFVHEQVESGRYNSKSEVIHDALLLLKDQAILREIHLEELRKKITEGVKALDEGRSLPLNEQTRDMILARIQERHNLHDKELVK
ncbi:MAG TPA: type II toxin-antitoxin system ParD family antitoxin [Blastocatellia bacterium]|nr:type II toxin-antitoxin system ParD family antitoxin [Blastocatellia bacterium]